MDFRVLGPVEVREGGHVVPLAGTRERALLALLLIHAGRVVSVDRLVDDLWDGVPPDNALSTLRVYISRLRKALGGGDDLVRTRPPGYMIDIDGEDLDATRFERLAREAHANLTTGEALEAAVGFRDALALWRGSAFADVADSLFTQAEAARFEELRLDAVEGRIEADLSTGRASALVAELEALTRQHPFRERLWGARMLALYRCGRQAEALRAYQELRAVLSEVGIAPSDELVQLEQAMLRQDSTLSQPIAPPAAPVQELAVGPDATALGRRGESSAVGIVTILFSDLVGSTELLERVGDDASEALRRTHFGLLREAVSSHAGTEVKNLGDGLMVVFGSAVDALECATAMQKAVLRHNRRAAEPMSVRVGVHVGEPIVDESDYFGMPVVVAKRLCDRAEGGQVLVSDLVRTLVGSRGTFVFRELDALSLKGLAEAMKASELVWDAGASVERPPLPQALLGAADGFVGRDRELADLRKALDVAASGRCRVVFIAGEPGIGKTTLASRIAAEAHANDALVLFGRCDEETLVAYQPIVEALANYLGMWNERDLADRLGGYAADLALLVPVLRTSIPGLPEPTGAENERWRLFEAFAGLLAFIAAEVPLILVLDDLHWADRPTLQLLQHAIRRLTNARLLILGTYRDTDLVRTHPMAETLADLRRAGIVDRLALRGLTEDDVLQMVTSADEPPLAERELASALWSETEGSPLFVREILRHLEETDAVVRTEDGWRPQRRIDQLGIPEGVREVIGRRLNRLSEQANAALHVGAVLGREFDLDVLERVSGMSIDDLLDIVDDACAAGITSEEPGVGRYSFTHALVRQALYDELSLSRRVRLHQRVGEALEELHARRLDDHLAQLAFHFVQAAVAGNADKAIDYARRAGQRAMGLSAYEEAARHFEMALEVAEDAGGDAGLRADLLLEIGAARLTAGDQASARTAFTKAGDLARRSGDSERLARAALGFAGFGIRLIWIEAGHASAAVAPLEEALAALDTRDSELRARLMGCLAGELHYDPAAHERRAQLSSDAVLMARRIGNAATLGYTLATRVLAVYGADTLDERLSHADELLALSESLGDRKFALFAHAHASTAAFEVDDLESARDHLAAYDELVEVVKDPADRALSHLTHAVHELLYGRLAEANRHAFATFQISQETRDPNGFPLFGLAVLPVRLFEGKLHEFPWAIVDEAADFYVGVGNTLRAGGALVALARGDDAKAQEWLDETDPDDELAFPRNNFWLYTLGAVGWAADALGDKRRAAQVRAKLLPYRERNVSAGPWCLGPVTSFLGLTASTLGDWDSAVTDFEESLTRSEQNGWRVPLAESHVRLAEALYHRGQPGDRARFAIELDAGVAVARDVGAGGIVSRGVALRSLLDGEEVAPSVRLGPRRLDRARAMLVDRGRRTVARLTRRDSDSDLLRRYGAPLAQRAMFAAVARSFQPANAFGFEGDIVHELRRPSDDADVIPSDWWTVEVRGRKATARRGTSASPAATIHVDLPDFVRLISGELASLVALVENRVEVEGDVMLAARLVDMFGSVELASIDPAEA